MKKFNRIYIEITNKCNLKCSFCSKDKRKIKEMTTKEFSIIIKEVKKFTNTICLHVKGEPLLHSKIKEILNICDNNNITVSLTTNGTYLAKKITSLKNHPSLKKIHISLNAETKNKDYLKEMFKAIDELENNIIIIYRLWAQSKNTLSKESTICVEKLMEHYNLSTDIVEKIKRTKNTKIVFNKYVDKDYLFDWPTITKNKTNSFCEGLKSQIAILVDGTVTTCCLDSKGENKLGNILKEPLEEILIKEKTKKIIKSFQENKSIEKLCQSCTYKNRFNKTKNKN